MFEVGEIVEGSFEFGDEGQIQLDGKDFFKLKNHKHEHNYKKGRKDELVGKYAAKS